MQSICSLLALSANERHDWLPQALNTHLDKRKFNSVEKETSKALPLYFRVGTSATAPLRVPVIQRELCSILFDTLKV